MEMIKLLDNRYVYPDCITGAVLTTYNEAEDQLDFIRASLGQEAYESAKQPIIALYIGAEKFGKIEDTPENRNIFGIPQTTESEEK